MAEEIRQLSEFTDIVLHDWGKLVLKQGDTRSLIIEADEEFLEHITSTIENGVLELRVHRKWFDMLKDTFQTSLQRQKVTYRLTAPDLRVLSVAGAAIVVVERFECSDLDIQFSGAGEITFEDLLADSLDVVMPGAGRLKLSGRVGRQNVHLSGAGSYSAAGLESESAKVVLQGVGAAHVHVTGSLDAVLNGVGSIEYFGDPEITKSVKGLGTVRRAETSSN